MHYSHNAELEPTFFNYLVVRRALNTEDWERTGDKESRKAFLSTFFKRKPSANPFAEQEPESPEEAEKHKAWLAHIEVEVKQHLNCTLEITGNDPYDLYAVETRDYVERNPKFQQNSPRTELSAQAAAMNGILEKLLHTQDETEKAELLKELNEHFGLLQELGYYMPRDWATETQPVSKMHVT